VVNGTATGVGGSGGAAGVRYASDFSGADGGEQIQAAIDDLPAEGGTVVVGAEGPDDGSNVTMVSRGDIWTVGNAPLSIPSNVTLDLRGAFIALADGEDTNLWRNATAIDGTNDRNENIRIIGPGRLHGNPNGQSDASSSGAAAIPNRALTLYHKVDGLYHRDLRVGPANGWAWFAENLNQGSDRTWVKRENIELLQGGEEINQDGGPIVGPARRVLYDTIYGTTGDDGVFISSAPDATGGIHQDSDSGGVKDVYIRNFEVDGASGADAASSFATTKLGIENPMTNIYYENVNGRGSGQTFFDCFAPAPATATNIKFRDCATDGVMKFETTDLTFDGLHFLNCDLGSSVKGVVQILSNIVANNMTFDGCTFRPGGASSISTCIAIDPFDSGAPTINDMTVSDCRAECDTLSDSTLLGVGSTVTLNNAQLSDNVVRGQSSATNRGFAIKSGATLGDVDFGGNQFINVTYPFDDNNSNGTLGETLGVTIDGQGVEAVGSTGSPTASNWSAGDIVRNSNNDSIWQLRQDGSTWDQLA
jgi:hypothetical protein